MLPGLEMMACTDLAVPMEVMRHVVRIESSFNPYAIGVVGGRLVRQPRSLSEAVSTARMLESKGYNFSLGLAQVNRYNLASYGLANYERAFDICPNLQAGSRILAECHGRAGGDWGKAFSCYYSGNFVTGFRHGYVQKIFASWQRAARPHGDGAVPLSSALAARDAGGVLTADSLILRRVQEALQSQPSGSPAGRPLQAPAPAQVAMAAPPAPPSPVYAVPSGAGERFGIAAPVSVGAGSLAAVDAGPVTVQLSGAAPAPGPVTAGVETQPVGGRRDDAFVF